MTDLPHHPRPAAIVTAESLSTVLGVVYTHRKTADGGDIYFTRFGLHYADLLHLDNWYEPSWFESKRERLEGTSSVYRVPTKTVNGRSIELVVKHSRVGEHVPIETRTLLDFLNAEFNSPWEEFALVFELREGKFGAPGGTRLQTQEPLAIYVPPETMQVWQSGRSNAKINRIKAKHPGIDLDILRQYKLIYGWIKGKDVVQLLLEAGMTGEALNHALGPLTQQAILDLEEKGYVMVDIKPCHIIIEEAAVSEIESLAGATLEDTLRLRSQAISDMVMRGRYSLIDYELLVRTPEHEEQVHFARRHSYLDDQRDRMVATPLPPHLTAHEILGVPYILGHAESTGGRLWVVGRNGRLFDFFLPERWRKTHSWKLSETNDVFYTVTKDHIHLVWKTSRVGETASFDQFGAELLLARERGFNSPFEAFSLARHCSENGIPTVYMRAIYETGTSKIEQSTDFRRYESHASLRDGNGVRILLDCHNYIMLLGYFNGTDEWVAKQSGGLCRPIDLDQALAKGLLDASLHRRLREKILADLTDIGCDGSLLRANDLLCALGPGNEFLKGADGLPEVRICNFELIKKI
ncbi:MAG: hypothetical protein JXA71_11590 [Chitinispirillaceae bacterium]|nr:hypothetical protein [Chitinispirillaceae bacterium]